MWRAVSFLGFFIFLALAWLLSENRKRIDWRLVAWGCGLQLVFALVILKTKPGEFLFDIARIAMTGILNFTQVGAEFIFGRLASDPSFGAQLAFRMLPVIVFTASLMAILHYLRVIPFIVSLLTRIMQKSMRASGPEALAASLFVFMGIEAVTGLKGYLEKMSRSELFTLMTAFMATIAGSVMAIYTSLGAEAGHLLAASVMSAPCAIVLAKILVPETGAKVREGAGPPKIQIHYRNILEATSDGAQEGLQMALGIGAMLLAFISLIALFNYPLQKIGLSFEKILGMLFTPFAILMGVPVAESLSVGELLGIKTVFNEFLAYVRMQEMVQANILTGRTVVISTYALCGFANFGSLAILIGGVGALAPSRKAEVVDLGLKSLVTGTLAKLMTASIAGTLI